MPRPTTIQLLVRTPHEVILSVPIRSMRVLTETGHVGLRPGMEPSILPLEAGVVHATTVAGEPRSEIYIGTAGGLLMYDHQTVTLLTPIAVVGADHDELASQFDDLMTKSNSELEARTAFNKLEGHILSELRRQRPDAVSRLHATAE